ncbi:MAG TPA: hypothetical protein QF646_02890, partial [Candidatus Poseidoniales archaeon]|nr:hypothetical protein [Candidatus Poseidoniales archaeon]
MVRTRAALGLVMLMVLSTLVSFSSPWNDEAPRAMLLDLTDSMEARNASKSVAFNTTWTKANSPYYLNHPVTVQKDIRLTIEAGVKVYSNTTNGSIIVNGELWALGNTSDPVWFGPNPANSYTSSSGYWRGIYSNSPYGGLEPLMIRNATISGPSGYWYTAGSSSTGHTQLLNTRGFFRTNSHSVMDNLTIRDGNEFRLDTDNRYSTQGVTNLKVDNMSYFYFDEDEFTNLCKGTMRDQVTVSNSSVRIQSAGYLSMGQSTHYQYCHDYESTSTGWVFNRSHVVLDSSNYWYTPTASRPVWWSGEFIDSSLELQTSSTFQYPLQINGSTFSATAPYTSTVPTYARTKPNGVFVNALTNSYGKWLVTNNSFAPTNGWTNLEYTYNVGHMRAPYNWWGSNNTTSIDANITDILDGNGAGWANYSPFWKEAGMTTLDWNGS